MRQALNNVPVHHERYTVRHREADRHGALRLAGWFDFLQEAAANHATLLGVGLEMLQEEGMMWVLSRLKLEIDRFPGIGEEVNVETYPNGFRRIYASRQFRVTDGFGAEIGRASSRWLLLDAAKLRPLKLERLPVELPDNSARPDYFELEEKFTPRNLPTEMTVPVRYSMEDINAHLNNAEYAGLIQDFAAQKLGDSPVFREIEMHYLAAVKAGDTLAVAGEISDGGLFAEGYAANGAASFLARARFVIWPGKD